MEPTGYPPADTITHATNGDRWGVELCIYTADFLYPHLKITQRQSDNAADIHPDQGHSIPGNMILNKQLEIPDKLLPLLQRKTTLTTTKNNQFRFGSRLLPALKYLKDILGKLKGIQFVMSLLASCINYPKTA